MNMFKWCVYCIQWHILQFYGVRMNKGIANENRFHLVLINLRKKNCSKKIQTTALLSLSPVFAVFVVEWWRRQQKSFRIEVFTFFIVCQSFNSFHSDSLRSICTSSCFALIFFFANFEETTARAKESEPNENKQQSVHRSINIIYYAMFMYNFT